MLFKMKYLLFLFFLCSIFSIWSAMAGSFHSLLAGRQQEVTNEEDSQRGEVHETDKKGKGPVDEEREKHSEKIVQAADRKGKAVMENKEEGDRGEILHEELIMRTVSGKIVQKTESGEIVPKMEGADSLMRRNEQLIFLEHPLADGPFGDNPFGEYFVYQMFFYHFVDFFQSKDDDEMRQFRLIFTVTAHIYFFAKFAHNDPVLDAQLKDWLKVVNLDLYTELGLCALIKMRQAYDGKHLDQVTNIAAKECATDKRESVQKLLKDNEATIQESIYQLMFVLPLNDKIFTELENLLSKGDDTMVDSLRKKLEFLFGRPRLFLMWELHSVMKTLIGDDQEGMLLDCMLAYFKEAEDIVNQWRYIFVFNFYTYYDWYETQKEHLTSSFNAATKITMLFVPIEIYKPQYWLGEMYMRKYVAHFSFKLNNRGNILTIPPPETKLKDIIFAQAKEIFLNTEAYAMHELTTMPSYVEAVRKCLEKMKTALESEKDKSEKNKREKNKSRKEPLDPDQIWNACVKKEIGQKETFKKREIYTFAATNLKGQAEMRTKKLVEMLIGSEPLRNLAKMATNKAKLKQLTKHTWAEIEQMIKQHNALVNTAGASNSSIENKNTKGKEAEKENSREMMDKEARKAEDLEREKIRVRTVHTVFLDNPLAEGAIDALLQLQYIGYYLSADNDNDEKTRTGRLMMAVTANIYFLAKYDSKIPKKKNKNILKRLLKDSNLFSELELGLCKLILVRREYAKLLLANSSNSAADSIECKMETVEKLLEDEEPSIQETIFQMIMVILPKKNSQFSIQTKKVIKNATIPEKEFIRNKFAYLFGRPRLFQLSNMKDEMAELVGIDDNQILQECMQSYFIEAENIVDQWRYIFVQNFYTYREWWLTNDDITGVPIVALTKFGAAFDGNEYWQGENYMRKNFSKTHPVDIERLFEPIGKKELSEDDIIEEIKEIILDTSAHAFWELNKRASYLEAMRQCTEEEKLKNGKELNNAKNASKSEKKKNARPAENNYQKWNRAWEKCMDKKLKKDDRISNSNRAGQGELRALKLVELFKDSERLKQLATDPKNYDKLTYLINASRPAELLEEIKDDEMREKLLGKSKDRDKEKPQQAPSSSGTAIPSQTNASKSEGHIAPATSEGLGTNESHRRLEENTTAEKTESVKSSDAKKMKGIDESGTGSERSGVSQAIKNTEGPSLAVTANKKLNSNRIIADARMQKLAEKLKADKAREERNKEMRDRNGKKIKGTEQKKEKKGIEQKGSDAERDKISKAIEADAQHGTDQMLNPVEVGTERKEKSEEKIDEMIETTRKSASHNVMDMPEKLEDKIPKIIGKEGRDHGSNNKNNGDESIVTHRTEKWEKVQDRREEGREQEKLHVRQRDSRKEDAGKNIAISEEKANQKEESAMTKKGEGINREGKIVHRTEHRGERREEAMGEDKNRMTANEHSNSKRKNENANNRDSKKKKTQWDLIKFKELNDIVEHFPTENENGTKKPFDSYLMKLYTFYFEDQNVEHLEKIKILIGISTLVKIIEEKFVGSKMLKEKGNFAEIDDKIIVEYETEWHKFKQQNLAHPPVDLKDNLNGMRELLDKIYIQYKQFLSLSMEAKATNDGNSVISLPQNGHMIHKIVAKLQRQTFSQLLASISENDISLRTLWNLKKEIEISWVKSISHFNLEKLQKLIGEEEADNSITLTKWLEGAISLRKQIELEIHLREYVKTHKNEKSEMVPENWINPKYFGLTQPELSAIMTETTETIQFGSHSHHDETDEEEKLKEYLQERYKIEENGTARRNNARKWVETQIKEWLVKQKKNENEFLLCLGGSSMLGTYDNDTDMDIVVILPHITLATVACNVPNCIDSHHAIYSECCHSSLLNHLKGAYQVGGPEARMPLIRLYVGRGERGEKDNGIQVDLTFVMLPSASLKDHRINRKTNLESHENEAKIKWNINLMKSLIKTMNSISENDNDNNGNQQQDNNVIEPQKNTNPYQKDIWVLSSYLFLYRLKYQIIKKDRIDIFINIVKAIKLWAKGQHIYSNMFGYLSGTSLSILVAKICLMYPTGDLNFLLEKFFYIFNMWEWPKPVLLEDWKDEEYGGLDNAEAWQPENIDANKERMPVIMTQYLASNTVFNINAMSRIVIRKALENAYDQFKIKKTWTLAERKNFWESHLFKRFNYEEQYDTFFLLTCLKQKKPNWEADCGGAKKVIRNRLHEWREEPEIVLHKYGIKLSLIGYVEMYHVLTGFEQKGTCKSDKGYQCMAWIVGLKFIEAKLNTLLAEVNNLAETSNAKLAGSLNDDKMTEKSDVKMAKKPIEKLTMDGLKKILMETLAWRIEKIVQISYAISEKELKDSIESTFDKSDHDDASASSSQNNDKSKSKAPAPTHIVEAPNPLRQYILQQQHNALQHRQDEQMQQLQFQQQRAFNMGFGHFPRPHEHQLKTYNAQAYNPPINSFYLPQPEQPGPLPPPQYPLTAQPAHSQPQIIVVHPHPFLGRIPSQRIAHQYISDPNQMPQPQPHLSMNAPPLVPTRFNQNHPALRFQMPRIIQPETNPSHASINSAFVPPQNSPPHPHINNMSQPPFGQVLHTTGQHSQHQHYQSLRQNSPDMQGQQHHRSRSRNNSSFSSRPRRPSY